MNLDKKNIKAIRGLILFTAVLILIMVNMGTVVFGVGFVLNILKPFLYGGAIAFILNIPLNGIEKYLFSRWRGKSAGKFKRPLSILLALITVILLITIVILMVVPQLVATTRELGHQIPAFIDRSADFINGLLAQYPAALEYIENFNGKELNWDTLLNTLWGFAQNGLTSVLSSTFTMAGNIVSGIVTSFIALVFSLYLLSQKENLQDQCRRVIRAYGSARVYGAVMKVCALLYKNFSNFITGQCLEAVILGSMFALILGIFKFPYAIMIGVLIAFTALIPIVGAFIGCFIGAFLILVDSPQMVIWFIITFLILQQIEGNLIYPKVVGNSVGLPSLWVLAAVTVGGSLMGVGGMLVFIPLLSTVYALLREDVNIKNSQSSSVAVSSGSADKSGVEKAAGLEKITSGGGGAKVGKAASAVKYKKKR